MQQIGYAEYYKRNPPIHRSHLSRIAMGPDWIALLKMNVQFSTLHQALLLTATLLTLTDARPTSHQSNPMPDLKSHPEPHDQLLPAGNYNLQEVTEKPPDASLPAIIEGHKPPENPNLFEGDLLISPEEIERYYGKQNNTHVKLIIIIIICMVIMNE